LFAQRRTYPKSYIGVYVGINESGFAGDYQSNVPGESGKYRLRTQYGFYGNIYIRREFSIYTALELDFKGAMTKGEINEAGVNVSFVAKTNLTSLAIPALFSFTPRREWGIMIGPQFTYIFSAKEPWYKSDFYQPDGYEENVLFKFNKYTADGVIAVNYMIFNQVTFQLRYTLSLMPIVKSAYGNARNSSILFFLGINLTRP
jgi:hypothetical protein